MEVVGLPSDVANGTNRIGVFAQSSTSSYVFRKNGKLMPSNSWNYMIPTIVGAILGILVSIWVSNEQFKQVFKFLMIVMLFVILIKPKRWLQKTDRELELSPLISIPIFLALGFYGGFIQMGMGVYFLITMVLLAKYSLTDTNIVKAFVVAVYTILAIIIYQYNGLIDWKVGLTMAVGQTLGGWIAANYASKYPQADVWAYRLLIFVVILAIFKLFNLHTYLSF